MLKVIIADDEPKVNLLEDCGLGKTGVPDRGNCQ